MSKITGNEPMHSIAMPGFYYPDGGHEDRYVRDGITIRQYFAAMAMQGILAGTNTDLDNIGVCAVDAADYLIAELNR